MVIKLFKKIYFLSGMMHFLFFLIIGRLFYIQVIDFAYYQEKLVALTEKEVLGDTMPRGKIYDKNDHLLVDNTLVRTIYYKKDSTLKIKEEIALAYKVKDYMELDNSKLTISYLKDFYILTHNDDINKRVTEEEYKLYKERKITDAAFYNLKKDKVTEDDLKGYEEEDKKAIYLYYLMTNGYAYDDKIIKVNATEEEFAFFSESNYKLSGFDTKYTYERLYLYGDTFKTILGNVGSITSENKDYYLDKGYSLNDTVGLSNLEFIYDDYLKGEKETYKIKNNEKILIKDGKVGKNLYLTIDINLQKYIDEVLDDEIIQAKNGVNTKYFDRSYVMVSDPNTGSILAMSGRMYQQGKTIDYSVGNITDTMTVGSVIKGASMLVGYNEGVVKIGQFTVDECIKLRSTAPKCSIYTMGYLNDLDALAKSSNVYQFKIALKIGGVNYYYDGPAFIKEGAIDIYRNYFSLFGLGAKTGVELPNESTGFKGKTIDAGLLMNFAIGQYDTYTNLQLNQYIATLANGTNRYEMHLLKEIKDGNASILNYETKVLNTLESISPMYIARVKEGLRRVVTNGTGRAYVDANLNVSAKTGTSETFVDSNNDGNYETESISTSFVAYMPSDNPVMAISITTPNISYVNSNSSYIYPFNKLVIKRITDNYYNLVNNT